MKHFYLFLIVKDFDFLIEIRSNFIIYLFVLKMSYYRMLLNVSVLQDWEYQKTFNENECVNKTETFFEIVQRFAPTAEGCWDTSYI